MILTRLFLLVSLMLTLSGVVHAQSKTEGTPTQLSKVLVKKYGVLFPEEKAAASAKLLTIFSKYAPTAKSSSAVIAEITSDRKAMEEVAAVLNNKKILELNPLKFAGRIEDECCGGY